MFETDRLPAGWEIRLNEMDEVWVPTSFTKKIFEQGGVDVSKLHVIGEPVDVEFFDPNSVEVSFQIVFHILFLFCIHLNTLDFSYVHVSKYTFIL